MKFIKYFFIVLFVYLLLIFSGVVFEIASEEMSPPGPHCETMIVDGNSMSEAGYHDGAKINVCDKSPEIGDIVVFECKSWKCGFPGRLEFKYLRAVKGDCWWLEGNKNSWEENGEIVESLDSHIYGWLCGDEFSFVGAIGV